ncbi:ribosome hibernation-promoting factor, HPF/YfiA family [Robertkochia solimangrovi]|uniref:ribosome hibernation-promoting factor, HPF/YfiA family n=1 Tax=Robertkochia solimangrovi TaxID=2213046 RepID=UPI0011813345|nr:ribosome-associated translation inhibitor RaiA [Robertkochia solimangrovi]TRZ41486.1 ribosome-associated translation inhibitor RaiA [Robertkochia solimangrovi]
MEVNTQSVNFNVDQKLVNFIQKRMDKLDVFYDRVVHSDVYLKVQKTSMKENKIAEIKVHVPGDEFVVKKQCKTFEEAIDSAASSLERVLTKRKQKLRAYI